MFSLQIRMLLQHCRASASLIFVYCLSSDDSSSGGFILQQQQLCQNTNSGNMKCWEEAALCTALASGVRTLSAVLWSSSKPRTKIGLLVAPLSSSPSTTQGQAGDPIIPFLSSTVISTYCIQLDMLCYVRFHYLPLKNYINAEHLRI